MTSLSKALTETPWRTIAIAIGLITLARLVGLYFNVLNLGPDETQYWHWSQTPAFGYFSKPPMIAWVIGLSTSVLGDAEWAVRAPFPIIHGGTALVLFALAKRLYTADVAFWASLAYATLPAVSLSSSLATTDVPLLLFWSLALLWFHKLITDGGWTAALATGVFVGLGLLSKYAMVYFPIGMALVFAVSREARRAVKPTQLVAIAGIVGLSLTPNILWNLQNDFSTVSHTAANANWGASLFNFDKFWKFFTDQFGVFGPIFFAALLGGAVTFQKRLAEAGYKAFSHMYLASFAAPPLLVVSIQAFISRAHANWAASAYPAAIILVAAWLLRARIGGWLFKGSVAFHAALAIIVGYLMTAPGPQVDALGLSNAVKRLRDWPEQGAAVAEAATEYNVDAILLDDREVMGELLYYARPRDVPIVAWRWSGVPHNHYELTSPFDAGAYDRVLYVTRHNGGPAEAILEQFENVTTRPPHIAQLDYKRTRTLYFYELSGFKGE
ncbi:MAG: glycosyltransferase family 39 protein [Pseudomonadota bacterium]